MKPKEMTIQEMAKEHANKLIQEMGQDAAFIEAWKQLDHWTFYEPTAALKLFWSEVKKEIEGKNENHL